MAQITGRHVLVFTVGAFSIIIAVIVLLAWKAISTFPGLEVQNSYVASQQFDAEREAQTALGWTLTQDYQPGAGLFLTFTDAEGLPVQVEDLQVLVGRSTSVADDQRPNFVREAGRYTAAVDLAPGKWVLHVEAKSPDGTGFRQRLDLFVKG